MNPIFQTSLFGSKATVYENQVSYRPFFFSGEISIPMSQIASVQIGMPGLQQITIETTGGKEYKMIIRLKDKEAFRDAIYKAKK